MNTFNKTIYDCFNYHTNKNEIISEEALKDLFNTYVNSSDVKYFCNDIDTKCTDTKIACYNPNDKKIYFNYENMLNVYGEFLIYEINLKILTSLLHELSHTNQVYFLKLIDSGSMVYNSLNSITKLECILTHYSFNIMGTSIGETCYIDYPYNDNFKHNNNVYKKKHDLFTIERLAIIDSLSWACESLSDYETDEDLRKLYEDYFYLKIYKSLIGGYDYTDSKEKYPIQFFLNTTLINEIPMIVRDLIKEAEIENPDFFIKLRLGLPASKEELKKSYDISEHYSKEYQYNLVTNDKIRRKTKNK